MGWSNAPVTAWSYRAVAVIVGSALGAELENRFATKDVDAAAPWLRQVVALAEALGSQLPEAGTLQDRVIAIADGDTLTILLGRNRTSNPFG